MQQPKAKIYQPSKTAMQSGRAKTHEWMLEYQTVSSMTPDPLMGWNTSADTLSQIQLKFPTREAAIAYAKAKELDYHVIEPKQIISKPKSYAANFSFNRRRAYTDNC